MSSVNPHRFIVSSLSLLYLPAALKRSILAKNANENIREHFKIRDVYKTLRDDADHVDTLFQVDLIKTHHDYQGILHLERACLDVKNPTAMFLKAISDFMYTDERADAFSRLKHCVVLGIKPALYCYEVYAVPSFLSCSGSMIPILSNFAISALRKHVSQFQRITWPMNISATLTVISGSINHGRIASCPSSVYRYWLDLLNENVKGLGMCDLCFWSIETSVFFRVIPGTFFKWVELIDWEEMPNYMKYMTKMTPLFGPLWSMGSLIMSKVPPCWSALMGKTLRDHVRGA